MIRLSRSILMKFLLLSFLSVSSAFAGEITSVFNGKDLSNWTHDIPEHDGKADAEPAFLVKDGVLVTTGKPLGHLITKESFENYTLTLEYRYPEKAGNCGVLIHSTTERFLRKVFPRSIEVQLMSGKAGDFIPIGEDLTGPRGVSKPDAIGKKKNTYRKKLVEGAEKKPGDWNTMIIHCQGDTIVVLVNGTLMNVGTKSSVTKGKIALQSEGVPVEFRKVEVAKRGK